MQWCPTHLDNTRAKADCAYSRCGMKLFGFFYSCLSYLLFLSSCLWETARYRLNYCLKEASNPNQSTNQPTIILREHTIITLRHIKDIFLYALSVCSSICLSVSFSLSLCFHSSLFLAQNMACIPAHLSSQYSDKRKRNEDIPQQISSLQI